MFIKPMLAKAGTLEDLLVHSDDVFAEPKHDGMRAIISKSSSGKVKIYGRSGIEYTDILPDLVSCVKEEVANDTVLDGELGVLSGTTSYRGLLLPVIDFNRTMRVMGSKGKVAIEKSIDNPITFLAFDCLYYDGESVMDAPLWERKDYLWDAMPFSNSSLGYNPGLKFDFESVYNHVVGNGGEGLVLKDRTCSYRPGKRAKDWLKIKHTSTYDVVVTGYTDAEYGLTGKFNGLIGALEFSAYNEHGELTYIGKTSGMSDVDRVMFTKMRDEGHRPFVIEIKANDLVGAGTPRHPRFVRMRDDKAPRDCTTEQFK